MRRFVKTSADFGAFPTGFPDYGLENSSKHMSAFHITSSLRFDDKLRLYFRKDVAEAFDISAGDGLLFHRSGSFLIGLPIKKGETLGTGMRYLEDTMSSA
jgi:hypothetical protein